VGSTRLLENSSDSISRILKVIGEVIRENKDTHVEELVKDSLPLKVEYGWVYEEVRAALSKFCRLKLLVS